MTQQTFASILDAPATEFVRPPALPAGTFVVSVKGLPRRDKSTKKGTDYIEHTLSFHEPFIDADGNSDVDAQTLDDFGPLGAVERKLTFYITEKSGYRYREFLEDDLGIDMDGKSLWEGAQEATGNFFLAVIRHVPREDGKGIYDEIGTTLPMPE